MNELYTILGIQGPKAPLSLGFASLSLLYLLPLSQLPQKATIFAMKSVMYIQTHERTPPIIQIDDKTDIDNDFIIKS